MQMGKLLFYNEIENNLNHVNINVLTRILHLFHHEHKGKIVQSNNFMVVDKNASYKHLLNIIIHIDCAIYNMHNHGDILYFLI